MIFALDIYRRTRDYAFGAAIDVETEANQKNPVTVALGRLLNIQCGLLHARFSEPQLYYLRSELGLGFLIALCSALFRLG